MHPTVSAWSLTPSRLPKIRSLRTREGYHPGAAPIPKLVPPVSSSGYRLEYLLFHSARQPSRYRARLVDRLEDRVSVQGKRMRRARSPRLLARLDLRNAAAY